jgi:hypothetical protein
VNIKIRQGTDWEDTFQDCGPRTVGAPCRPGAKLPLKPHEEQRFGCANRYHPVPLAATSAGSDTSSKKSLFICSVIQKTNDLKI